MDYKDKLRLAKEALDSGSYDKETIEYIFPELAESDDEKIRKELISFVRGMLSCHDKPNAERDEKYESWIAWLEKQQNPEVDQHSLPVSDDSSLPTFDESIYHPCTEKSYEKKPAEDRYMEGYLNGINDASKTLKSAVCSEEDEKHVNSLLKCLEGLCRKEFVTTRFAINEDEDWLKNLKDRVQPKQEWSEEDERHLNNIIKDFETIAKGDLAKDCPQRTKNYIPWLKSLRPHQQWKPSDEKMEYLAKAITTLGDEGNCKTASILNDLRVELKKLMEK